MKTKEQIQDRITELKKFKSDDDYEVAYLRIALMKDEATLNNLYLRYKFELDEDTNIIKALSWVLDKE